MNPKLKKLLLIALLAALTATVILVYLIFSKEEKIFVAENMPPRTCSAQTDSELLVKKVDLEYHFGKNQKRLERLEKRFKQGKDAWRASPIQTAKVLLRNYFCITDASYTELQRGEIDNQTHAVIEAQIEKRFFELELVRMSTNDDQLWLLADLYWVDKSNFAPFPRPEDEPIQAAARFNAFQWSAFPKEREIVFKREPICMVKPEAISLEGARVEDKQKKLGEVTANLKLFYKNDEVLPRVIQYRLEKGELSAVYTVIASDKYTSQAFFKDAAQYSVCLEAAESAFKRFGAVTQPDNKTD